MRSREVLVDVKMLPWSTFGGELLYLTICWGSRSRNVREIGRLRGAGGRRRHTKYIK